MIYTHNMSCIQDIHLMFIINNSIADVHLRQMSIFIVMFLGSTNLRPFMPRD